MNQITRRDVIAGSMAGGLLAGLGEPLTRLTQNATATTQRAQVRVAVIGLGGIDVVGGVGGRGRQLIRAIQRVPAAELVAICDVDESILNIEAEKLEKQGQHVATYVDLRQVLDDKNVDAVFIATPNHWHALATIWACQAGKDVYVEKPFSHNIWEGKQMVAAARKYDRLVQVGTQRRSSSGLRQAFEHLHSGSLGAIKCARAIVYRPRNGIGKVTQPTPVPKSLDYDLWCGPAPKTNVMRKQLHYEWHWFWSTGNGEVGNNGAHEIDVCRWALGQNKVPSRVISIGGRFGFDDAGETPNTHIALLDYQPAPLICEIRNWRGSTDRTAIGSYRDISRGLIVDCEGGYFRGDKTGGELFDLDDRKITEFRDSGTVQDLEVAHVANFVDAVLTRDLASLNAEAREGHLSATCVHMANISYRLGSTQSPAEVLERARPNPVLTDAYERCQEYLQTNGLELNDSEVVFGPWLNLDADQQRFIGDFAQPANELSSRQYRKPFIVPQTV